MKKIFIAFTILTFAFFAVQPAVDARAKARKQVPTHRTGWTATYYGDKYKTVRHTANGQVFNMHAMTCAAPKHYKFGTKLRVTNVANGKSVVVTVTDRGGFGNRCVDLTYGAFGKIANHRSGRIKVNVEVVG